MGDGAGLHLSYIVILSCFLMHTVYLPTVIIYVNQLKDSITDFRRCHTDVTRLELDFVNNLCERHEKCISSSFIYKTLYVYTSYSV